MDNLKIRIWLQQKATENIMVSDLKMLENA